MHPNDKVFALQRAVSLVEKAGEPRNVIEDLRERGREVVCRLRVLENRPRVLRMPQAGTLTRWPQPRLHRLRTRKGPRKYA
jgi:hypothetical protein